MAGYYDFDATTDALVNTPDHTDFPTGSTDLDVRAYVVFDTSADTRYDTIASTGDPGSTDGSWWFTNPPNNTNLQFVWRESGGTTRTASSASGLTAGAGTGRWYRATLDVSNGSSVYEVTFYYSDDDPSTDPDSVSWTQHGSSVTGAAATTINDGAAPRPLAVGNRDDATRPDSALNGRIYKMQLRKGIDGLSDDFTGTNGDPWDTGKWLERHNVNGGTPDATIQSNKGRLSVSGLIAACTARTVAVDTTGNVFDEYLTLQGDDANALWVLGFKTDDLWGNSPGSAYNATTATNPYNGYFIEWYNGTLSMAKQINGTWSLFSNWGTTAFTSETWFRFQYDGTTIRAKHWTGTKGDEPGTWGVTDTDSALAGKDFKAFFSQGVTTAAPAWVDFDNVEINPPVANPDFTADDQSGDSALAWTTGDGVTYTSPYWNLTGEGNSFLTSAYDASLNTTDLDFILCLQPDTWSPSVNEWWANRMIDGSTQTSWVFGVTTGGTPRLEWSTTGTGPAEGVSANSDVSTVTGVSDGTPLWIRVTLDVDNGSSQREVRFYYSEDPPSTDPASVSWTEWSGSPYTGTTTSIYSGTSPLQIGRYHQGLGSNDLNGRVYKAVLRSSIGGSEAVRLDGALVDATGKVWQPDTGATWSAGLTYSDWSSWVEATTQSGTPTGTGAGSLAVTGGDATGQRTRVGTAAGSLAVTGGDATGQRTGQGTGAGSLAVTGGDATGQRTRVGTAAGSLSVVGGDATGQISVQSGTGAGSLSVSGDATGSKQSNTTGTGAGSLAVSGGDATGQRTGIGTAAGSLSVAGDSTGHKTAFSTAEGSLSLAGDASGTTQGNKAGTGAGAVTVTGGDATGARTVAGTATGALTVAGGDATAQRTRIGSAAGAVTVTGGDATGEATKQGTAAGAVSVTGGDATGAKTEFTAWSDWVEATTQSGTATGTGAGAVTVAGGDATAVRTVHGTAEGSLSLAGDSTAERTTLGAGAGAVSVGGDATATRTRVATAEGSLSITGGNATGQRTTQASGAGSLAISGEAFGQGSGNVTAVGAAAVSITGGDAATHVSRHATATGSLAISGDATANKTAFTTAEGSLSVAGNATGNKQGNLTGTGEASVAVSGGDASAQRTGVGSASGFLAISGDGTAHKTSFATAEGSLTVSAAAFGQSQGVNAGVGAGSLAISGDATGQATKVASAEGNVTVSGGDATGQVTVISTGEGAFTITGVAVGERTKTATAEGSITVVGGDASTQRTAVSTASGFLAVFGNAIGRSDTSNFNFNASVAETWGATLEDTYDAEMAAHRWTTGGVHL